MVLQSIFGTILLGLGVSACNSLPHPVHRLPAVPPSGPPHGFVVIGDTQRTGGLEERVCGREQNEADRVALIDQLASEESPEFVVHVGDMVTASTPRHWHYFRELMAPLAERRIPLVPVLGNHEYMGHGPHPEKLARRRFDALARGGYYVHEHGALRLLLLDSNLKHGAARRQLAWLDDRLAAYDCDASVRAVLLFMHHPPFTNGENRVGSAMVRDKILERLRDSKKGLALFSGHVHGYERFEADQVSVIVTGGGGGPRVGYRTGSEASVKPAAGAPSGPEPRPLNYVVVEQRGPELVVTAKCLKTDRACRGGILDTVRLPLPEVTGCGE